MTVLSLAAVQACPWDGFQLEGIDLQLESGQVLGVIGPNGAGKSSLLQLLAGDILAQSGQCDFLGTPMARWSVADRARCMAVLPQLSLLNFPYTVEEVVLLGRTPHGLGAAHDRSVAEQVMRATDILALRERVYTRLSGGEKQRVQLARVFAQVWDNEAGERLLLLDEPTTALDLAHQQLILASIKDLSQRGCAVVLVAHDFNLVAAVADQLVTIADGRVVASGSPQEVLTTSMFADVFGVSVSIGSHPVSANPLVIQL